MRLGIAPDGDVSPEQKQLFDKLQNSRRGKIAAPFQVLAQTPQLADAVSNLGAEIRYNTALPSRLRELAILTVAATSGSGVEWRGHEPLARQFGAREDELRYALFGGHLPNCADAANLIDAVRSLLTTGNFQNPDEFVTAFGKEQTTELVVLVGYYRMLAMVMAVGDVDSDISAELSGVS